MKVYDYTRKHRTTHAPHIHMWILSFIRWNIDGINTTATEKDTTKMESSIFNILVLIDAIRRKVELMTIYTRE